MSPELAQELLDAAQAVVNNAALLGDAAVDDPDYRVYEADYDRLKAVVQAISDAAVALYLATPGDVPLKGEAIDWAQIEAAVGHPFTPEEREKIAPSRGGSPTTPAQGFSKPRS